MHDVFLIRKQYSHILSWEHHAPETRKGAFERIGISRLITEYYVLRETTEVRFQILQGSEKFHRQSTAGKAVDYAAPSEKAWAYKMKLDALKHQGVKDDSTCRQLGDKQKSVSALSENSNDSARNIHRFIRLTELLPDLLQMVDDKKLPFNPAVELSYLTQAEQEILLSLMTKLAVTPSLEQAKRLKKYSQDGKLDENVMDAILTEVSDSELRETQKAYYYSNLYLIDRAVPSTKAQSCRKYCTFLSSSFRQCKRPQVP